VENLVQKLHLQKSKNITVSHRHLITTIEEFSVLLFSFGAISYYKGAMAGERRPSHGRKHYIERITGVILTISGFEGSLIQKNNIIMEY
jgi:hypothetical protein